MPVKAKEVNLTERPFLKKIITYIIPLVFTGLLQSLYNAADLVIVGRFRGPGALAAVGTTGALTNLILGLFMGLSVGAGVVVAHHIGALEYKKVSRVVHSAVALSAALGVIMGGIGFIFSRTFLSWMGTVDSPDYPTLTQATLYLRIIFCGAPASFVYNYCTSIVNATGETKKPLIFLAISGAVNLFLNVVLVAGFGMGVDGVAIGTIASQYLSAVLILLYMRRVDSCIKFSFRKLCFDMSSIKRMLVIGVPSGIQGTLFSLSNVLIQSSVNSFGDMVMAGNAAAANLEGFVYVAMNAVYKAALTFAGQNMGAKKYKNIKLVAFQTVACTAVIGLASGALILLFREFFVGLYVSSDGITPEAYAVSHDTAMTRLFYILPVYFLCGVMEALCGVIRGMGKSTISMVFSLVGACALRIVWIQTVFRYIMPTIEGIYISYPVSWLLVIALDIIYLIFYYRKLTRQKHVDEYIDRLKV
ncbi:MAG: MATE family efflux transporter [Clostridia bacterium]|nr:MATE family efflux transporter [Clostridia bacterium]